MSELFRVRQNVDRMNAPVGYVQCDDGVRSSVEITDYAWFSIDPRRATLQALWQELLESTQYPADDIVGTADKVGDSNCFPATVGVEHDIMRQQSQQAFHITGSYRLEKALQQVILLLCRGFEAWPRRAHM